MSYFFNFMAFGGLCAEHMELLLDLGYTVPIVKLILKGGSASESR